MAHSNIDELKEAFGDFLRDFRDFHGEYKYIKKIERLIIEDQRSLVIDYEDLILMDEISPNLELADTLITNPNLMVRAGNEVLTEYIKSEEPEFYKSIIDRFAPEYDISSAGFDESFSSVISSRFEINYVFVRFNNSQQGSRLKIRDIRAKDIQDKKIYWLEGIIIRTTEIKSIISIGVFNCDIDQHEVKIQFDDGIYVEPTHCDVATCEAKKFYFRPESSRMVDWQFITLQEKPEDLPPGTSPKSIPCQLTNDLVNTVRPGDRVNLGGIIRMRPSKTRKKGELLTYDYWVEVNHIESASKEDELKEITPEEEQEFLEMARDPKVFDQLLNSIAPQIYGLENVKKAALLMLFGGVDKKFPDGFSTRGQPNVLLIGDPGVAKSQILRYVQSIAPRGLFTSGKGSSAAGLTAAITRDPDTGEITLEAGAMVLADRGVCLIDEFDKMNENDRSAIHEAMEQHTVSIAKAGIVATLNARTGVMAAANPRYGRYEDHRSFNENVNLTPAILSRFDLLFVLRDIPDTQKDGVLANHILKLHRFHGSANAERPPLDEELLKKYISYAKQNYHPTLSEEASELLETYYVEMREISGDNPRDRITITARQLEGIIRLAEARARSALKNEVSKQDAQFAIDLMRASLEEIARDPETGQIDIDAFYSGQTGSRRGKLSIIQSIIDNMVRASQGSPFSREELIEKAVSEHSLDRKYVEGVIQHMITDGSLYNPSPGMLDKI